MCVERLCNVLNLYLFYDLFAASNVVVRSSLFLVVFVYPFLIKMVVNLTSFLLGLVAFNEQPVLFLLFCS